MGLFCNGEGGLQVLLVFAMNGFLGSTLVFGLYRVINYVNCLVGCFNGVRFGLRRLFGFRILVEIAKSEERRRRPVISLEQLSVCDSLPSSLSVGLLARGEF